MPLDTLQKVIDDEHQLIALEPDPALKVEYTKCLHIHLKAQQQKLEQMQQGGGGSGGPQYSQHPPQQDQGDQGGGGLQALLQQLQG